MQNSSPVLSLFYCYAHEDTPLRIELDKHLAMLRQVGWIQIQSDRDINAGTNWRQAMDRHMETADVLLLLVSANFINSDYCYSFEMQHALQRHQAGEAVVIPILLRPVDWEKTPLGTLQILPRDGRPITNTDNIDEAFKQIAMEIRLVVETLRKRIIVASLLPQQMVAARIARFLATHNIPVCQAKDVLEQRELKEAIRESFMVVLVASPETRSSRYFKEIQKLVAMYRRPMLEVWAQSENQGVGIPREWHEYIFFDSNAEHQEVVLQKLLHNT